MACASWSPDSNHLVFATSDEPLLYAVSFLADTDNALPILDLSEVLVDSETELIGGGLVQDIAWEPTGQRLAVSFRSTSLIAIFSARCGRSLSLTPCGWIRGRPGEFPSCFQFQPSEQEGGGVLTVAWSSGRIQHFPFLYSQLGFQAAKIEHETPNIKHPSSNLKQTSTPQASNRQPQTSTRMTSKLKSQSAHTRPHSSSKQYSHVL
mgnify:CR=1 FL=1